MLETLFKSRTLVSVLGSLLTFDSIHVRGLARRASTGPTNVKRELEVLRNLNLASEAKKGNLSLWSINKHSPLYPEIRNLFFKTELAGNYLSGILKKFNPAYAFIFGSFAKGTEREGSDIDLFLVGKIDENELIPAIEKAQKELGREINYILWSEKDLLARQRGGHSLISEVSRNPIIWLWGDEDGFRRIVAGRHHTKD